MGACACPGEVRGEAEELQARISEPGMGAHAFNPRFSDFCKFNASLVHKANSRTAKAVTQKNTIF